MSSIAVAPGFTRRSAAHRPTAAVRLTPRGRLVVLGLLVVLALTVFGALGDHSAATGEVGEPVPTRTVVVEPGDTLWDIAASVAAPGQTREMIHQIEELNALPSVSVRAGQELAVPVG